MGQLIAKELKDIGFNKGRILDVGTGSGELAVELAKAFPETEVTGLDLSEPLLEIARQFTARAGLNDRIYYKKGDAQALPFNADTFDVVVSLNTLHVVDDPVAMLDEIERVLVPNGVLTISDIKRTWLGTIFSIFKTGYSTSEVEEILRRSKLRSGKIMESFLWFSIIAAG